MPWQLSARCIRAIQAHREAGGTQLELCRMAAIHPVSLSRWLHHYRIDRPTGPGDQRVRRLAALLDLAPLECVERVDSE